MPFQEYVLQSVTFDVEDVELLIVKLSITVLSQLFALVNTAESITEVI